MSNGLQIKYESAELCSCKKGDKCNSRLYQQNHISQNTGNNCTTLSLPQASSTVLGLILKQGWKEVGLGSDKGNKMIKRLEANSCEGYV